MTNLKSILLTKSTTIMISAKVVLNFCVFFCLINSFSATCIRWNVIVKFNLIQCDLIL